MNFYLKILILLISISTFSSCGIVKKKNTKNSSKIEDKNLLNYKYAFFEANKYKMLGDYNKAGAYFLQCLELNSNSAASYYELAQILAMAGDYENAIKYTKKAYLLFPENKWYLSQLIELYKTVDNSKEAIKLQEKYIQQHTDDFNAYLDLTDSYLKKKEWNKALSTLSLIEKKYGYSEELMLEKNKIYIQEGNYKAAQNEINKLITKNPNEIKYQIYLADLYMQENKKKEAFNIYKKLRDKYPNDGKIRFSTARYYLENKDTTKAFEELLPAVSSKEIDLDTKIQLLFPYVTMAKVNDKQKQLIDKIVKDLVAAYPDEIKSHSLYADLLIKNKEYKKAQKELQFLSTKITERYSIFEQLLYIDNDLNDYESLSKDSKRTIELFPNQAMPYFFSGIAFFQNKEYKKSANILEIGLDYVIQNNALQNQFYILLGDAYHKLKNNEKSNAYYEKAIALNPKNDYVINNYSYYLSLQKTNLGRAETLMKGCIERNPKNATFLDTYAWCLFVLEKYEKALPIIKKAYDNGGNKSAVIVEHYGDILFKNNKKEKALEKWQEADKLGKASKLLKEKINKKTFIEE